MKFGDLIRNKWASDDNPRKEGFFVSAEIRRGIINPGRYVRLSNGKTTWEVKDGGNLTVVANAFDVLEKVNHTLVAHGHMDANTPLHELVASTLSKTAEVLR